MADYKITTLRMTDTRAAQIAALERLTGLSGVAAVVDFALASTLAQYRTQEETMYTIDGEKLAEVTRIVNEETDPRATEELIRDNVCADWHEGQEHQDWINKASAQEIADWLATFYGDTA